jgi:hypothetical protein
MTWNLGNIRIQQQNEYESFPDLDPQPGVNLELFPRKPKHSVDCHENVRADGNFVEFLRTLNETYRIAGLQRKLVQKYCNLKKFHI